MAEKAKEEFKDKYINQIVRITTKNKRVFEGKLKAIDFRCNLVVYETTAYIIPEHNCPLNRTLNNSLDSKMKP